MISIKDGAWYGSVGNKTITGPLADANRWTFVGLSYDGNGRAYLYIDNDDTQYQTTGLTPAQGQHLGIGYGGTTWTGTTDLVRIYSTYQDQSIFRTNKLTC